MSTHLKNPKDQADRKKGMLSNQPRVMRVTPTALLGSWVQQPIKDMTLLRTDFEMQGYSEEHLRCLKVVTHLFGDGDLDGGHHMVSPPTAKEFIARKTHTIASSKVQGTEAVLGQATMYLYSQVWNFLRIPCPSCTAWT
jgi:hypothetical protein